MPRSSTSRAIPTGSRTRTSAPRHPPRAPKSGDQSLAATSPRASERPRTPHPRRRQRRNRPNRPLTTRSQPRTRPLPRAQNGAQGGPRRRASGYALRSSLRSSLRAQPLIPSPIRFSRARQGGPLFNRRRWSTFRPALTRRSSNSAVSVGWSRVSMRPGRTAPRSGKRRAVAPLELAVSLVVLGERLELRSDRSRDRTESESARIVETEHSGQSLARCAPGNGVALRLSSWR